MRPYSRAGIAFVAVLAVILFAVACSETWYVFGSGRTERLLVDYVPEDAVKVHLWNLTLFCVYWPLTALLVWPVVRMVKANRAAAARQEDEDAGEA